MVMRRRRRGARPADRADLAARPEAIPVPAVGLEPLNLHVNGVGVLGDGPRDALLHHAREALVGGDLPRDRHRLARHAATIQEIGSQSRPQHDPARQRVAGGDPEREGIRREARRGRGAAHSGKREGRADGAGPDEERAA